MAKRKPKLTEDEKVTRIKRVRVLLADMSNHYANETNPLEKAMYLSKVKRYKRELNELTKR